MKKAAIVTRQLVKTTGAARNTHEQIRYLKSKGYDVDVYAEYIDKEAVSNSGARPIKIWNLPLNSIYRRKKFWRKVERKIKKNSYDIVFGHGDISQQDILFLHNSVFLASELIYGKSLEANNEMSIIHGQILKEKKFKFLVANSHMMKTDLISRFGINENKVSVIHPGYDQNIFNVNNKESAKSKVCLQLGIDLRKKLIGLITSGNFKKRNISYFIDSLAYLSEEHRNDCEFLVIGKTKNFTPFRNQANRYGLKIHFLEPQKSIESFYKALDIYCLPARWEEFGRVVLEAMACGAVCIVSDKVGAKEVFPGLAKEFIIDIQQKNVMADKIQYLLSNPEIANKLSNAFSENALKFTEKRQAEKLNTFLYERLGFD